jgi:hypothetical protein
MLAMAAGLASETGDDEREAAPDRSAEAFKKLMLVRRGKRAGRLRFCVRLGVNPNAITAPFTEHAKWAMDFAESVSEVLDNDADDLKNAEAIATRELDGLLDAWGDSD